MDNQKTHVESSLLEQMFLNSIWEQKTQLLWLNLCLDRFFFHSRHLMSSKPTHVHDISMSLKQFSLLSYINVQLVLLLKYGPKIQIEPFSAFKLHV